MAEPARKLDSTKSSAPAFNWEDPLDLESQLTEEERMIRDAFAYLDLLAREAGDDPSLQLELARGYRPPTARNNVPAPGESIMATLKLGIHLMRQGEYISEHEVKIGNKVAEALCGGNVSPGTPVSEQYLLDLEREAFLSLCGEQKTLERIQYMLTNNKPLRN